MTHFTLAKKYSDHMLALDSIDIQHLPLVSKFLSSRAAALAWQEAVEDSDVRMHIVAYRKVNRDFLIASRALVDLDVLSKYELDLEMEIT